MMMYEDAVAGLERMRRGARFLDDADRLVAEHRASLAPDIPRHDVAGADSTGAGADQDIAGTDLRAGGFFDADVTEIV
jgi:hypothetical protein